MNHTIEDRLRRYAATLDEASIARRDSPAARSDTTVVTLDRADGHARLARTRRFVAVAAVACVIVGAATFGALRRDHTASPAPETHRIVPSTNDGLRVLFKRTTPEGIVIVARAGLVPTAEAAECPIVPIPRAQPVDRYCTNAKASGVEFQYTTSGHTYRATVLDRDIPTAVGPSLVPMITNALVREVQPNGVTVESSGRPSPYLVVLHATDLADVRIDPHRSATTGLDEMAPVDGWVAFAAHDTWTGIPFDNTVEGLNGVGHVTTTALPWRCC
jgi:hypothetical protein